MIPWVPSPMIVPPKGGNEAMAFARYVKWMDREPRTSPNMFGANDWATWVPPSDWRANPPPMSDPGGGVVGGVPGGVFGTSGVPDGLYGRTGEPGMKVP